MWIAKIQSYGLHTFCKQQWKIDTLKKYSICVLSRTQQCFIALVATSFDRSDHHQANAI
jgi:hypothetical protein